MAAVLCGALRHRPEVSLATSRGLAAFGSLGCLLIMDGGVKVFDLVCLGGGDERRCGGDGGVGSFSNLCFCRAFSKSIGEDGGLIGSISLQLWRGACGPHGWADLGRLCVPNSCRRPF